MNIHLASDYQCSVCEKN